jgi:glycosyltransferase involved in cell wall biosynthesis
MIDTQKRLAFFLPDLIGGGAQRVTVNLVRGIAERGYAVDLVLAQAKGPYLAEVPASVRLINLNASRSLFSLPGLVGYLRKVQPVALLSAIQHVNIVAVWAGYLSRVSTRVVVSEHSVLSDLANYALSRRGRLMPQLGRFYYWADGIVAVSHGVGDDLAHMTGIPRERIRVIYNPVVTPELRQMAKVQVEHAWFGPDQPPVLLAAGRLSASKDFPTLIRAFAQVRSARPARLMILGEGEERPALEQLVSQLGLEQAVSLPGFVENPYAYMRQAALFVLSSTSEALPTVLIEALYCGLPLVSTRCPGGAREILADGRYGQLVPVGDVAALAQAIGLALDGNSPPPSPEGWRLFEMDEAVNQYLEVLLENGSCGH